MGKNANAERRAHGKDIDNIFLKFAKGCQRQYVPCQPDLTASRIYPHYSGNQHYCVY